MSHAPQIDPDAPLLLVINGASGHNDADSKREAIEAALKAAGRTGELLFARPKEISGVAHQAAARAKATRTAVVAVGGDGTINTVAESAHAEGCAMGVLPQGTFNYFARTHGIPDDIAAAMQILLHSTAQPVQVGAVNDKLFLVNASLGLYPSLLEDREAYKARFGRSRLVALGSAFVTLMREHRQLSLRIERGGAMRDVRTPTLFVGNNRLQLEQVGMPEAGALDVGSIAAVMLRPIGTLAMLWLVLRGAFGTLGDAENVDSFEFQRMVVRPWLPYGRRGIKIARDGEVSWMRSPLEFKVAERPLFLLKPAGAGATDPESASS